MPRLAGTMSSTLTGSASGTAWGAKPFRWAPPPPIPQLICPSTSQQTFHFDPPNPPRLLRSPELLALLAPEGLEPLCLEVALPPVLLDAALPRLDPAPAPAPGEREARLLDLPAALARAVQSAGQPPSPEAKAEDRAGEDRRPPGVAAVRLAAREGLAHFLLLLLSRGSSAAGALRKPPQLGEHAAGELCGATATAVGRTRLRVL